GNALLGHVGACVEQDRFSEAHMLVQWGRSDEHDGMVVDSGAPLVPLGNVAPQRIAGARPFQGTTRVRARDWEHVTSGLLPASYLASGSLTRPQHRRPVRDR